MENIVLGYSNKIFQAEQYKLEHEKWLDSTIIGGIDEVGRGCLFGPVVSCCAILKPFSSHPLLRDSKILTENQRLKAALWIKANSWYAFGIIDHRVIDTCNIYEATKLAMKKAYYGVMTQSPQKLKTILIDAVPLKLGAHGPEVISMTKGESKSVSIAAASILAKVYRDEMLKRLSKQFPGYALESNKGYGAKIHINALQDKGESLLHRTTFLSSLKKDKGQKDEINRQASLFC
jgi:ribonuclease HII